MGARRPAGRKERRKARIKTGKEGRKERRKERKKERRKEENATRNENQLKWATEHKMAVTGQDHKMKSPFIYLFDCVLFPFLIAISSC